MLNVCELNMDLTLPIEVNSGGSSAQRQDHHYTTQAV